MNSNFFATLCAYFDSTDDPKRGGGGIIIGVKKKEHAVNMVTVHVPSTIMHVAGTRRAPSYDDDRGSGSILTRQRPTRPAQARPYGKKERRVFIL